MSDLLPLIVPLIGVGALDLIRQVIVQRRESHDV